MKDRVVLLTGGAGQNMGGSIARAFATAGATLVIADLDGDQAEQSTAALRENGGTVSAAHLDAADRAACVALVDQVVKDHGRLDVLYNHAGAITSMHGADATTDEEWELALAVNMTAPFVLTRAALPHMLEQGKGAIVNTISEAGLRAGAAGFAYTASKHGLVGITRSIAWAYAKHGIRCNAICPGGTLDADMGDPASLPSMFAEEGDPYGGARVEPIIKVSPRFVKPGEIASVGLFLASDAASGINGQIVAVDGGWAVG
jgi:NAD(P)-dependent dehydrogenase (short-subunit alcohol dehydrogenase family)